MLPLLTWTEGLGYLRVDNPSDYDNLLPPIHDFTNMTVFTTTIPH